MFSLCWAGAGAVDAADPAGSTDEAIVQNYVMAERTQDALRKGATMDIDIEASLPKLKKQGRFQALRRISPLGLITYEKRRFEGDSTVRNQVILRYLNAEAEAQRHPSPELAITPDNYNFKFKGRSTLAGRGVYVFDVKPRKKRQGLFKGQLWVDAATYLRVQEAGYLVKSPSIFVKKIAFVRKYDIKDGVSVPLAVESVVDTRLVGKAELNIAFSNYSLNESVVAASNNDW